MAVWTPGSYLVREYSRHVEDLTAGGLRVSKTRKNRWRVDCPGVDTVCVSYSVYCHEMSVRTNWVDENFALLQGAATFLGVVGRLDRPHEVTLELPPGWSRSISALPPGADYDTLVDSPIVAGSPAVTEFEFEGKPHYFVNVGDDSLWDAPRAAADVEKIVREHLKMWGGLPYEKYVFFNILLESKGGGGLEHKSSFCVLASRYATRTRESYRKWLELVSHEFFHVWNVKRLRPSELGPFDYENENYTRSLWMAEGFTEYYCALIVCRAGLETREEYLAALSDLIERLQTTPGRLAQPVDLGSYDAWIKIYRPDENTVNTTISYYVKGAVIAWLLDAKLRIASDGEKSLDHLMRSAYERFSGERGFGPNDIQQLAGAELAGWFQHAVETTGEFNYNEALAYFGLSFRNAAPAAKAWLGFTTKTDNGQFIVESVPRGTPAFNAGFSAGDEIIAVNGARTNADQWPSRMEQYRPGERVELLVARMGRIVAVNAILGEDPGQRWRIEVAPTATDAQKDRLNAWLAPLPPPK